MCCLLNLFETFGPDYSGLAFTGYEFKSDVLLFPLIVGTVKDRNNTGIVGHRKCGVERIWTDKPQCYLTRCTLKAERQDCLLNCIVLTTGKLKTELSEPVALWD